MKKLSAFLVLCLFVLSAMAQDATIKKFPGSNVPVIDGTIDASWDGVDENEITVNVGNDANTDNDGDPLPTLDYASWKMAWNDTAVFILISAEDDNFCNEWCTSKTDWESDRIELFFNVNSADMLDDSLGAINGPGNGTMQITSPWVQDADQAAAHFTNWQSLVFNYGYVIDGDAYDYEFAIPFTTLTNADGNAYVPSDGSQFGFQVAICDVDLADVANRKFLNWIDCDAWTSMHNAGIIEISDEEISVGIYNYEITSINMYPNPASTSVTIDAVFDEIEINNIIGQKVLSIQNIQSEIVDISNLETGIYFISIYNNNELIGSNRLVIE